MAMANKSNVEPNAQQISEQRTLIHVIQTSRATQNIWILEIQANIMQQYVQTLNSRDIQMNKGAYRQQAETKYKNASSVATTQHLQTRQGRTRIDLQIQLVWHLDFTHSGRLN